MSPNDLPDHLLDAWSEGFNMGYYSLKYGDPEQQAACDAGKKEAARIAAMVQPINPRMPPRR